MRMKRSNEKAYHIIVSGRVQGIGFRYYSREKATLYGVKGWIRNLVTGHHIWKPANWRRPGELETENSVMRTR
jgi:hypothetical protein